MVLPKGTLLVNLQRANCNAYEILEHQFQHRLNKITIELSKTHYGKLKNNLALN